MSIADIPGRVSFGKQWPLGLVLAIAIGGTLIYASSNARLTTLEASVQELKASMAEREQEARKLSDAVIRIEEKAGATLELVKEIRNGARNR